MPWTESVEASRSTRARPRWRIGSRPGSTTARRPGGETRKREVGQQPSDEPGRRCAAGHAWLMGAKRAGLAHAAARRWGLRDRKSTRLNSSHSQISYAVFCLKKKKKKKQKKPKSKENNNRQARH